MTSSHCRLPDCPVPEEAPCLEACSEAGRCLAGNLRLTNGDTYVGRPLGAVGETLRFLSLHPERGTVLVPFASVEATSLYEALVSCFSSGDASGHLHLAEICSSRGLVDLALRELNRAVDTDPLMKARADEVRATICEQAADRRLHEAREHMKQGRQAHARAALDDLLQKFPSCTCTSDARDLRLELNGGGAS